MNNKKEIPVSIKLDISVINSTKKGNSHHKRNAKSMENLHKKGERTKADLKMPELPVALTTNRSNTRFLGFTRSNILKSDIREFGRLKLNEFGKHSEEPPKPKHIVSQHLSLF